MSVLVTGGFGMLGSATARELIGMGQTVVVMGRSDHRERLAGLEGSYTAEIGDLTDPETVYDVMIRHRVHRVCHVAAVLTSRVGQDPRLAFRGNVAATVHLLGAARSVGAERFVFTSSKAVYAMPTGPYTSPTYQPVPEDYRREPNNLYGATKMAAELMVEQYARATGMSCAVLRFGTTYGPGKETEKYGDKADISRIIEASVRDQPVRIADTGERTDCIYVGDIGWGIALATVTDHPGFEAYNIATGIGVSLREVLDAAQAATSSTAVTLVPTERDPASDRRHMVLDVAKAEAHLGFRARFTLEEASNEYIKSLKGR